MVDIWRNDSLSKVKRGHKSLRLQFNYIISWILQSVVVMDVEVAYYDQLIIRERFLNVMHFGWLVIFQSSLIKIYIICSFEKFACLLLKLKYSNITLHFLVATLFIDRLYVYSLCFQCVLILRELLIYYESCWFFHTSIVKKNSFL